MSDQTPPPVPPQEPSYSATPASSTPSYGASPTSPYTGGGAPAQKPAVLSIISLVLGILGVVGFFVVFIPIVGSIMQLFIPAAAIVLGFLGKSREPWAPKGLWLTGIILGFVGLAIALISLIGWIILFATAGAYNTGTSF
ncbi:hypothetical protein [Naasia sp. SYSU D00948]|uniref:hypothetical protein n=1 Tax=Naasia sp. SYSU D00948 TaxID=2817379 RepID=UPI001B310817|nr:hypothetical protein [Naasia sp. SYSU D00948]